MAEATLEAPELSPLIIDGSPPLQINESVGSDNVIEPVLASSGTVIVNVSVALQPAEDSTSIRTKVSTVILVVVIEGVLLCPICVPPR